MNRVRLTALALTLVALALPLSNSLRGGGLHLSLNDAEAATIAASNNLGLIGYWNFNEATGTIAHDASGNKDNGTLINSPMWTSGKFGDALSFNGASQYVTLPNAASKITGYPFSVSAWVYQTSAYNDHSCDGLYGGFACQEGIVHSASLSNAGIDGNFWLGLQHGFYRFVYQSGNNESTAAGNASTSPQITGQWVNLVGIVTSTETYLYEDGALVATSTNSWPFNPLVSSNLEIARWGDPGPNPYKYFTGAIDDVRVYDSALSPTQITDLYEEGAEQIQSSGSQLDNGSSLNSGLVGYWSFDGSDLNWTNNTAADLSGNGHTGTLSNMAKSTSPVTGKLGQALQFNGINQSVAVGSTTVTFGITNAFSISAWVYPLPNKDLNIMANARDCCGSYKGFALFDWPLAYGGLVFTYWDSTGTGYGTSYVALKSNAWSHVVATFSNGSLKLYINGVLTRTASGGTGLVGTPFSFYTVIGEEDAAGDFGSGKIDDVRLYNRALSPTEVKQSYDLGSQQVNASAATTTSGSSLSSGLVGYWTMDGQDTNWKTGTEADRSGNGNVGRLVNLSTSTSPVAGKLGQALQFSLNANYISIPYSSSLHPTSELSVSLWFKTPNKTANPDGTDGIRLLSTTESGGYSFSLNDTGLSSGCTTALCFTANVAGSYIVDAYPVSNLSNNTWYHVVGVYDGTAVRLYVNGVQVTSAAASGSVTYTSNNPLCIGAEPSATSCTNSGDGTPVYFNGSEDDVRIYNRAISASEVKQLYLLGH